MDTSSGCRPYLVDLGLRLTGLNPLSDNVLPVSVPRSR